MPHTGTDLHYPCPANVGVLLPGQAALRRVHGVQLGLDVRRDEGPEGPQHQLVLDLQPCPLIFNTGNKCLERLPWSWAHGIKRTPALRRREAPSIFDHRLEVKPRVKWATFTAAQTCSPTKCGASCSRCSRRSRCGCTAYPSPTSPRSQARQNDVRSRGLISDAAT